MLFYIPAEFIALATFPGIIIHEIAHRFFCDVFNVDVYHIRYFIPLMQKAGHVVHAPTDNLCHRFFIGAGPLIINSLVCMILTFPAGCIYYLDVEFAKNSSFIVPTLYAILSWIGYSIGIHAMPSDQDVNDLVSLAKPNFSKLFIQGFVELVMFFNLNYLGFLLRISYAGMISLILPMIFFRLLSK
jgi:hypothetical protein